MQSDRGNAVGPLGAFVLSLENLTNLFGGDMQDIPTLPQEDEENTRTRNEQLLLAKALYRWSSTNIPAGVPYLDDFPPTEQDPSIVWVVKVVGALARVVFGVLRSGQVDFVQIALALISRDKAAFFVKMDTSSATKKCITIIRSIQVGVPYLDDVLPSEQDPSLTWVVNVVGALARDFVGVLRSAQIGSVKIALAHTTPREVTLFVKGVMSAIENYIANTRPGSIEYYNNLHATPMETPEAAHNYDDDDMFARLRLQGPNCVTIQKCTPTTRDKLKLLDTDYEYLDLKAQVNALMADDKLFVVDQELIKNNEAAALESGSIDRYLSYGIALFEATDDEFLPLKPIGIQLSQGNEATPIFTPADGYNWMIAKTCFEATEFVIHEVVSHLGNTHLVMEGALVGIYRNFAKEHPIHVLMTPHLEGTALINWGAQDILLVEEGGVDKLVASRIEDCWQLASEQTLKRVSGDFSPEADIENRGMTKNDFPGRYMYRDYGLRFWEATHTWVKEYLSIYYISDADVEEDSELMAFVDEMASTGKVLWLEEVSTSKDTIGVLAKVLASYISPASTLHAVVNFPQQSVISYNPATPGSVYQSPSTDKETRTFEDYLDYLPPMQIATLQVVVTTLLGSVHYTNLGDYKENQFVDERVQEPLANFQDDIEGIEIDLEFENSYLINAAMKRGLDKKEAKNFGYKTPLPDNIPQSINI